MSTSRYNYSTIKPHSGLKTRNANKVHRIKHFNLWLCKQRGGGKMSHLLSLAKVLLGLTGALVHWVSFFFFHNVDGPSFKTRLPSQRIHWSGKAKYTNWHRLISISGVCEWMGTPRCYCLWMEKGYPLIFWSETQWQLGTLQCQVASEPIVYSNAPAGKAAKILLNGETICWTLNLCRGMFQL